MEEETPMPTKDDIYFELLQYCDINPDYDIDDEIRTNMRLYAINELYRKFYKLCEEWRVDPEIYKTTIFQVKDESPEYTGGIRLTFKMFVTKIEEAADIMTILGKYMRGSY